MLDKQDAPQDSTLFWMSIIRDGKVDVLKKDFHPENFTDHDWWCLFSRVHITTRAKADKILRILIERGGNINAVNGYDVTTLEDLMHVCTKKTLPYLDLFVKHGALIAPIQDSLIGLAASHGRVEGLIWLDKKGVDITRCRGEKTYDIFKEWAEDMGRAIPNEIQWLLCDKELHEHLQEALPSVPSASSKAPKRV